MDDESETRCSKRKFEQIIDDEPVDKRCRTEAAIGVEPSIPILCNSNHEPLDEDNFMEDIEKNEDISDMIHADSTDTISMQSSNFDCDKNNLEIQPNSLICSTRENDEEPNLELNIDTNGEHFNDHHTDLEIAQQSENNNEEANDHNSNSELVQQNENGEEAANDNANGEDTTPNVQNVIREKCKYGDKCYRLNQEHKKKYSHPNDDDYDQSDDRPECPYGIKCYRKNPQHKLDYKHTRRRPTPKRSQSPLNLSDSDDEYSDESVNESEYEPSFIDDDDEDDVVETEYFDSSTEDEE